MALCSCTKSHACSQACAWHYKSIPGTLLSNFHFLHYTQILHCLKDQWWAFDPPLWAFGPIKKLDMTSEDMVKLFYFMTFIPKLHFLATRGKKVDFLPFLSNFGHFGGLPYQKGKKLINEKVAPCRYLSGVWPQFFHFQSGRASKWPPKTFENCVHVWASCACVCACACLVTFWHEAGD